MPDYEGFLSFLGVTLIFFGMLLYMMPVGECDRCPHCRSK